MYDQQGSANIPWLGAHTKSQRLAANPDHPPQLLWRTGEEKVSWEPEREREGTGGSDLSERSILSRAPMTGSLDLLPLGFGVHDDGDVSINERKWEEFDAVQVLGGMGSVFLAEKQNVRKSVKVRTDLKKIKWDFVVPCGSTVNFTGGGRGQATYPSAH